MQSNDTSSTISTSIPNHRPRLRALVGGVIAVGGLTFGIGAALAQESPQSVPAVSDHQVIAEMARANGLTGLSPASLAPTTSYWYRDNAAIADWARSEGLTGLSPASLTTTDD